MAKNDSRTVWSSEHGDVRKHQSSAHKVQSLPPSQQLIHVHRDSKGRGGKTVTIVKNLVLSENDIKDLSKKLKQLCGRGGTVKDDTIEIQGEHREKIAETLIQMGYKVKIAGG